MRAVRLARTVSITFGLLLPALAAAHPLDPLTADEIRVAAQVARADARFASAQFASILLNEPAKADVMAWRPGTTLPRQARLVVMTPASVFEVVVDLTARRLVSATERKGVEPPVMMSEFEAAKVVLTHPEFRAALAKRGVTDPEKVFCSPFTAGYFAIPEHAGKRIIKVGCYDLRRTTTNMWGWPIERLYAVVDLRERKVLERRRRRRRTDRGSRAELHRGRRGRVARGAQADGDGAAAGSERPVINGNEISWGNWRFHARVDGRVGTVISVARWQDGDQAALGALPGLPVRDVRAVHGCRLRVVLADVLRHGRVRRRHDGDAAQTWRSTARRRPHFCRRRSATTRESRSRRRTRSASSSEAPAIRSGGTPSRSIRPTKAAPTSSSWCAWPPPSATTTTCSTGCSTMQPRSRCASVQLASMR